MIRILLAMAMLWMAPVGCSGDTDKGLAVKKPAAAAEKKGKAKTTAKSKGDKPPASVSTPPLELATTTEATGMQPPPTTTDPLVKEKDTVAFSPTEVKAHTNVIILFDASGSMAGPIESDTKMSYVKTVVRDLIAQPSPSRTRRSLGLRVYGSQHPVADNNCEDSLSIAKLGALQGETVISTIQGIEARGTSPIAYALQNAAAELPDANAETDNMIIVIADGGDTCNADPCLAAEQIHSGRTKAMVHVIGFDLDQASEKKLRCVAKKSDGRFFLARNIPELRSAADQALNANLPYNLRVKSFAGQTPLPTQMTVYRSGTRKVVEQGRSTGIKFFQLQPGSYDILIAYEESVQEPKPSKLLKGVEVQGSARAEQVVYFDLGLLELAGIAPYGQSVALTYTIHKPGDTQILAEVEGQTNAIQVALTPGEYAVTAKGPTVNDIPLIATYDNLSISAGETTQHTFRFETGELVLRAQNSQGAFISATYTIAIANDPDTTLSEGTLPPEGKTVPLPVGEYVIQILPLKGLFQGSKPIALERIVIPARDRVQELVSFPVGVVKLIGKDSAGTPTKTEFVIRRSNEEKVIWRETVTNAKIGVALAPGLYQVVATRLEGKVTPAPTIVWEDIELKEGKTQLKEAIFQLGTLNLVSKDAKGDPLTAEFTIYRPGVKDPIATQRTSGDPLVFQLTPGLYDVLAKDMSATGSVKPKIWTHGVTISANFVTEQEIIFTSGRVRITCRGTNDTAVACNFRIFTYGQDAPLYAGDTLDNFEEFEMNPGFYYIEVGYDDLKNDYYIKKWVNIAVAENQTVEKIVRF